MKILPEDKFLREAIAEAHKSTCLRSRCGSVVIKGDQVIGHGFNSPPGNLESQRRCNRKDELKPGFKSDRTCCVHAEQRAILDAARTNPNKIKGSILYFIRLNAGGNPEPSGKPYCTICSKLALDVGISQFVLWHGGTQVTSYDTAKYNDLSYSYDET